MSGGANVKRTFNDEKFRIFDDQDKTKKLEFELENLSSGTTRTITVLDTDITLGNKTVSVSSEYTVTSTDYFINCTSNSFAINLPTAVGASGKIYQIKNSGTGIITVTTDGSETIDGSLTENLFEDESITIISDNSNWYII